MALTARMICSMKAAEQPVNFPNPFVKLTEGDISRFWKKVNKSGADDCWNWTAGKFRSGYGAFSVLTKLLKAHRISYMITNGPIPEGLFICHKCDNPSCVNPSHLWPGTNSDNLMDASRKGRIAFGLRSGSHTHPERRATGDRSGARRHPETHVRGERVNTAKLTAANVVEIRRLILSGESTQTSAAIRYGVTQAVISKLVLRQTWKHVQ